MRLMGLLFLRVAQIWVRTWGALHEFGFRVIRKEDKDK